MRGRSADVSKGCYSARMSADRFDLESDFQLSGDQPQAVAALCEGLEQGLARQTLLGVTGSGKTYTLASVVARQQRPALVLAPNKTLAAQLYGEFRDFFPRNRVEYFVSYYDYYQPEAYVPSTDTYIEKDASINSHIEQMRLSATKALMERKDTIVVATVSAIYGLGDPDASATCCGGWRTCSTAATRRSSGRALSAFAAMCWTCFRRNRSAKRCGCSFSTTRSRISATSTR